MATQAVQVEASPLATQAVQAEASPLATQAVQAEASPVATQAATEQASQPENTAPQAGRVDPATAKSGQHLALGVGYPDLRVRYAFGPGLVAEGKFAFDAGIQVYTARLSWNFQELGPLKIMASTEAGFANLDNVDTVSGNGATAGLSLGLEYPFARSFRVSVDAGPMWISANSGPASFSTVDVVYNTALYFYLF